MVKRKMQTQMPHGMLMLYGYNITANTDAIHMMYKIM